MNTISIYCTIHKRVEGCQQINHEIKEIKMLEGFTMRVGFT